MEGSNWLFLIKTRVLEKGMDEVLNYTQSLIRVINKMISLMLDVESGFNKRL